MSITDHLDAYESVKNFQEAWLGPGVYVLFQGPPRDNNIVYIGKSERDVMLRVGTHQTDKEFTHVGLVLPSRTNKIFIHNLEHLVVAEFLDEYDYLPYYNSVTPRRHYESSRLYDWHTISRREDDVRFISDDDYR